MKSNSRTTRISDEIKREVSSLIQFEIKDPRISSVMISVIRVETSMDLKLCKIYVSVFGKEKEKKEALEGLKNASGFVRKEIARSVDLRNTPEIQFLLDETAEYAMKMDVLISEANKG
ncbi:MAG: 30S ribosome-binding factor RbfA [Defluviitaleaceae bacterium]|nr:30S ribosome-binding factor RbfA [Defluviitaleaceae bacterium]